MDYDARMDAWHNKSSDSLREVLEHLAVISKLLAEMIADSESTDVALLDSNEYFPSTEQIDATVINGDATVKLTVVETFFVVQRTLPLPEVPPAQMSLEATISPAKWRSIGIIAGETTCGNQYSRLPPPKPPEPCAFSKNMPSFSRNISAIPLLASQDGGSFSDWPRPTDLPWVELWWKGSLRWRFSHALNNSVSPSSLPPPPPKPPDRRFQPKKVEFEVLWDPTMPPPPPTPPDSGHRMVVHGTSGPCNAGVMILLQIAETCGYLLPLVVRKTVSFIFFQELNLRPPAKPQNHGRRSENEEKRVTWVQSLYMAIPCNTWELGTGNGHQLEPFPKQMGQTQPNTAMRWASKKCTMQWIEATKIQELIVEEVTRAYVNHIPIDELVAPKSSLLNCKPMNFGGGHLGPNLTYAKELIACMGLGNSLTICIEIESYDYMATLFKADYDTYGRKWVRHQNTGRFCHGQCIIAVTDILNHDIPLLQQLQHNQGCQSKLSVMAGSKKPTSIIKGAFYIWSACSSVLVQDYYVNTLLNNVFTLEQFYAYLVNAVSSLVMDLNRWEARKVGMTSLLLLGCLLAVRTFFGFHETGFWLALSIGKIERLQFAHMVSIVQIVQLDGTLLGCALPDMGLLIEPDSFAALVKWHGSSTDNTFCKIWQDWKNFYNLEDKVVFNGGSNVMNQNDNLGQIGNLAKTVKANEQLANEVGQMEGDPSHLGARRGIRERRPNKHYVDFVL